jgi:septin family protein
MGMYQPERFTKEIIDFVKNASMKGLKSVEADQLIIDIHKSDMFTESEKQNVSNYIAQHLPNLLVDIFHSYKKSGVMSEPENE